MIINVYSYKDAENQVILNKNKRKIGSASVILDMNIFIVNLMNYVKKTF